MKKVVKFLVGIAILSSLSGENLRNTKFIEKENGKQTEICAQVGAFSEECAPVNLQVCAKSAYLMDFTSETELFAQNEEARLPIASMCKIMTLLLSFEAIEEGNLSMQEEICVSHRAASMGGSQVFLEENGKYTVENLLKSVVVASAKDSCVALAGRIAGSEELFVDQMNEKAKALGATNTLFANCTGLPKDPQYSSARDVAIFLKHLLEHEEYYAFGKVWMDKFEHPEGRYTEISNTNKLVRFYEGCDGGKTGFTSEAGFCLAATAMRKNLRVISVVIGEETSAKRFEDVRMLFDYAFANYSNQLMAEKGVAIEQYAAVLGGKAKSVEVCPIRSVYALQQRGSAVEAKKDILLPSVKAPVQKGEELGEMVIYREGVEVDRVPLVAMEEVKRASLFDCLKDIAEQWNG